MMHATGILLLVLGMTALRVVLAALFPMTNDEAYYWDWGRALQLSYYDHPPGVSWLTRLSQLALDGALAARALAPVMHLVATYFLFKTLRLLGQDRAASWWLAILTQLVPGLSLWGAIALPDTGLLPLASMVLYMCVRLSKEETPLLSFQQGAVLGLALGLAGSFKYHALPVAGGMALGLLWARRGTLLKETPFWGAVLVFGLVGCAPVWIWNLQNDFASFRYQTDHGFAGLAFKPLYFGRAFAGQLLLVSPLVFFAALGLAAGWLARLPRQGWLAVPLLGFLPLFLLIEGVAPFKQVLPHWIMPAFWVTLPFVAAALPGWTDRSRARWRFAVWHTVIFAVLTLVTPWVLAWEDARVRLLERAAGKPGPLAELTLWPDLAREVSRLGLLSERAGSATESGACGNGPIVVSQRWFWGAQLAYHLPGQPRVRVYDGNRGSYYDARDAGERLTGCPALILVDEAHLNRDVLEERLTLTTEPMRFVVPRHEAERVLILRGVFR